MYNNVFDHVQGVVQRDHRPLGFRRMMQSKPTSKVLRSVEAKVMVDARNPAKEQYVACSLLVPTSLISVVLTAMKNLKFVSANMPELCVLMRHTIPQAEHDALGLSPIAQSDFDVGEMLQGEGDAPSGCAAQRGMDLVLFLFHADVGLRHVVVCGEGFGLSNTLTHVSSLSGELCRSDDFKGYLPCSTHCPPRRHD